MLNKMRVRREIFTIRRHVQTFVSLRVALVLELPIKLPIKLKTFVLKTYASKNSNANSQIY